MTVQHELGLLLVAGGCLLGAISGFGFILVIRRGWRK